MSMQSQQFHECQRAEIVFAMGRSTRGTHSTQALKYLVMAVNTWVLVHYNIKERNLLQRDPYPALWLGLHPKLVPLSSLFRFTDFVWHNLRKKKPDA